MNVAVIGLGKLGLPLAVLQAENHRVFGIDANPETVDAINRGHSPIREPGVDVRLSKCLKAKSFSAHADYSVVADCDVSLIIVPTPSLADGSFTSEYVVEAVRSVGEVIKGRENRHVVVICSTLMPGECDTSIRDALEGGADEALGERLQLIYSPEFIALGSVLADMQEPSVIIIGCERPWAADMYYNEIVRPVINTNSGSAYYMSWTSAEISKIALNAYVTMKISFANALSTLCEGYPGANAHVIAEAIGTDPRVGHQYITPGGPYGGPCFPRDNRAFMRVGDKVGVEMWMPRQVDRVNNFQIDRMIRRVRDFGRPIVSIIGLSYKLGAPITEEAYGTKLAEAFALQTDLRVRVYDRLVPMDADLFPEGVDWFLDPVPMFGNDATTILALPDPDILQLIPNCFENAARQNAMVIDPWGCVPWGPWHESHIITLGLGD